MKRLDDIFSQKGSSSLPLAQLVALSKIRKAWASLVQDPLRRHTFPYSLKNGRLVVHVQGPIWLSEFSHVKEEILAELQRLVPAIEWVQVKVGEIPTQGENPSVATPARINVPKSVAFKRVLEQSQENGSPDWLKEILGRLSRRP